MGLFRPGTQVGDARIVRELGAGEVGTVYEVVHRGERRALKIVETGLVEEGSTAQVRAAQEGEAIAMVEHVNVVRWYDSGIDHGRVWILIELVEGSNLQQLRLASGGKLTVERAVALVRQACDGLAAVHKKGIVHRDMKPENILVTRDDVAKIADFGSAKLPGWGVKTTTAHRLTTMAYMAPELWRGAAPDPRCDVYAMGLILYELITGANPIVPCASDVVTMCTRHLQHEPPPLMSVVPDLLYALSVLVQRAMAKDPAQRCTMRELAEGLEGVLDDLLVWRRAAARSVPLPHQDPALALTAPMLAFPEPESSAPVPAPSVGARGTIVMQAASSRGSDPDREASPPPPPVPTSSPAPFSHVAPSPPVSVSVPSTLRTPSQPLPAPAVASEPDPRRSTGIPVESVARPSGTTPRRRAVGAILGGGVLVAMVTAAWWTMSGSEPRPVPKPAAPPPPTTSASAPPPVASSAKPAPSAAPRRHPRRYPSRR